MYGICWEVAGEVVEERALQVGGVSWVGVVGGVLVGVVGKGVMCVGWWGGVGVCCGWCIYNMEVDGLVAPEGRDYQVSVRYIKFVEVLKVFVARKGWLYDEADSSMGVGGWCGAVLAVIVDGDEIFVFTEMAVNVVLEIGKVGGVVDAKFLDRGHAVVLDDVFGDVVSILFDTAKVGGIER